MRLLESRILIDVALYSFNPFFFAVSKKPFSFLCVLYRASRAQRDEYCMQCFLPLSLSLTILNTCT